MIQPHAILSKLKMARISAQDRARIIGLVEGGMPYNQVSVFDNKSGIMAGVAQLTLRNYIASMRSRYQAVVNANGGHTRF